MDTDGDGLWDAKESAVTVGSVTRDPLFRDRSSVSRIRRLVGRTPIVTHGTTRWGWGTELWGSNTPSDILGGRSRFQVSGVGNVNWTPRRFGGHDFERFHSSEVHCSVLRSFDLEGNVEEPGSETYMEKRTWSFP
jgi:hypothetical protein